MIRVFVHHHGATREVQAVDPSWLAPDSGHMVWVDLAEPTDDEGRVLTDVFGFHDLAVESALRRETHPKIETYSDYLYLVLHGINFHGHEHAFDTHETDFFLGPNYLVTVVAQAAGVKTLVLSHLVPPDDPAVTDQMWIDAARSHFRGSIVLGKDLLEV